jgi:predicted enzyme related to lactoylglutathione lyase
MGHGAVVVPTWHPGPVPSNVLFAGVATADLDAAMAWYETLWGRPAEIVVNDDEVMWRICDGGWMYLIRDRDRAGQALVTVAVPDLDRAIGEVVGRGLAPSVVETIEGAGRKAPIVDPEGNVVTFIEVDEPPPVPGDE